MQEASKEDIQDFKRLEVKKMISYNNLTALRYWKQKLNLPDNEELLKHWKELKEGEKGV